MTRPIAQITAEEIAAAAGVSRRTFFNYFPTTIEAFLPAIGNDAELLERIAKGEPADLADCLADVVSSRAQGIAELYADYPGYFSTIVADPNMRALLLRERFSLDAGLREALARRFNCPEDDPLVNVFSHLVFILEYEVLHRTPPSEAATPTTIRKIRALAHALADAFNHDSNRKPL